MKLDLFLMNPLVAPYRNDILTALRDQIDLTFGANCEPRRDIAAHHCSFRTLRLEAKMSQQAAERATGIAQSEISRIERGFKLPTIPQFHALLDAYKIKHQAMAKRILESINEGDTYLPPAYYLLCLNISPNTLEGANVVWDLTVKIWNTQVGFPIDFRDAKLIHSIRRGTAMKLGRISKRTRLALERLNCKKVETLHIFIFAIVYRISPLSLINAILLETLWHSNTIIGGPTHRPATDEYGEEFIQVIPNEEYWTELKELIIQLGLIPEWQHLMWRSVMLQLLAAETDEETGVSRYLPFPLTPRNYRRWMADPILQLFPPSLDPPAEFLAADSLHLPHDELHAMRCDEYLFFLHYPHNEIKGWNKLLQG